MSNFARRFELQQRQKKDVYLMQSGSHVKVGISNCPEQRAKQLENKLDYSNIELVQSWDVPNARIVESRIHERLEEHNVGGEWFDVSKNGVYQVLWPIFDEVDKAQTQNRIDLSKDDISRIKRLATVIEYKNPALDLSNRDAVMWAVNHYLETQ